MRAARRRFVIASTVVLALALRPVPTPAVSDGTGLGIRILDAPTARADDPRARVYIVDHVQPGATISRRLQVTNDNPTAHHVDLYADAATISDDAFRPDPDRTTSDLTSWTTVEPTSLEMASREVHDIRVTIAVPQKAEPGERYGVVFAEIPADPSRGININSRVGIRIYLSVGEGQEPRSDFTINTLTASRDTDGTPEVRAQVHNTGGRALDMSGTLNLDDGPGSLKAGPFEATLGSTLKPGDTEPVTVRLDKSIPAGPWKAHLELMSGEIKRAATATITFPTANGTSSAPVMAHGVPLTKDRRVLLPIAGGLVIGLGLILLLILWRRRRDDRGEHRRPA